MTLTRAFKILSICMIAGMILANTWGSALAFPPPTTAPTIDGIIILDGTEGWVLDTYPNGTRLLDDSNSDSPWAGNEMLNVYINWDPSYLYLALDFIVDGNSTLLYLDFGTAAGVTNFLGTAVGGPYSGWWPRNIQFPATNGIDLVFAAYNGASGNLFDPSGGAGTTDISGNAGVAVAGSSLGLNRYNVEMQIPWGEVGLTAPIYPGSGVPVINVFSGIAGGDNYGFADTAPDHPAADGSAGPVIVTAGQFEQAGIGPTAINLNNLTARSNGPLWVTAFAALCLVLGAVVWSRRR